MGMTEVLDLKPEERRLVLDLLAAHLPGIKVWAFGSRVTFKARPDSDLDLVAFAGADRSAALAALREAFEESNLPFRVDLLNWDELPEDFKKSIEGGEVCPIAPDSSASTSSRPVGSTATPLITTEYSFLELLDAIVDNRGRTCPVVDDPSCIPLIATNCIRNDTLYPVFENVRYVNNETYNTWFRGHPEPGDMIFVCKGSPGRVCWVPDPVGFCIAQDMVAIRANRNIIHPKFLFAILRTSEVQKQIANMHVGTLIPHFKKGDFGNLYLQIPNDYSLQKRIGDIYFQLSEKIALNRATNQTLEALAQALFKSWFVDFDPVRAKARGERPLGMDEATAALFPDGFEDSELGEIPRGWEVKKASQGFIITMGQSPPGDSYNSEGNGVVFYQGRTDFGFRFPTNRIFTTDPKRFAKKHTTLVSVRAPVGDLNIADEDCCIGRGLASVMHLSGSSSFTYYNLKNLKPIFDTFEKEGTVFGAINKDSFGAIDYIQPPSPVISAFDIVAKPSDAQILLLTEQVNTLATIRDSLLPKLLSGDLSVGEAAEEVGLT